eukprot:m.79637 g.79637  ORF g.79637 m.79637 type:complete len:349 (+) comp25233_c0_seq5:195-1241(+)
MATFLADVDSLRVSPKIIAVFGNGSFGTAMATVIGRNGHTVRMLCRRTEVKDSINTTRKNSRCFTDFELPPTITATTDATEALKNVDYIVHCIPVQSSRKFLTDIKHLIPPTTPIICTSKGMDVSTLEMMNELIPSALGRDHPLCHLSGPSFAQELLDKFPTGVVMASKSLDLASETAKLFICDYLRVYPCDDVIGVEIGGALKNVFAIAAGVVEGMGLGLNTTALLVTRGCNEMQKLSVAHGARPETLNGLSGIGDLMLTCFGKMSRNRTVGSRLGKGETLQQIIDTSTEVAEGVATVPAVAKLVKKLNMEADFPMIIAIHELLLGTRTAAETGAVMMSIPIKFNEA